MSSSSSSKAAAPLPSMHTRCSSNNTRPPKLWERCRHVAGPGDKCQHPRQRWPEAEAVIQVFLRVILLMLHLAAFIVVLVAQQNSYLWPYQTFCAVGYGIILCVVEITCLTASNINPLHRFPRMGSFYLFHAEAIAFVLMVWSMHAVLSPIWRGIDEKTGQPKDDASCPIETCVTREEKFGLVVYGSQLVAIILHAGFFAISTKHWFTRKIPQWIQM